MRKNSLDRKIIAGFAGCTIVLITVAFISFNNSSKFAATSKWVSHTHEVLYEFENVLGATINEETGMRGFIISGKEHFLEPYNNAKEGIFENLARLRELTSDNPVQQKNINRLQKQVEEQLEYFQKTIDLRRKDAAQATAVVSSGEGKRLQDGIRATIKIAKSVENRLLAEREEENTREQNNFTTVFIILLVVIAIVLLAVYLMISANLRALRKAQQESDDKNWKLTGSSQLVHSIEGNQSIPELGQKIIAHLVAYLDAQSGLFYKIDKLHPNLLMLKASYAADQYKRAQTNVDLGEGLAGQVAINRKYGIITNIDEEQFTIGTGFGQIRPKNILAMPFIHEDRVIGVVEIASLNTFTPLHIDYLQSVMNAIALAIVAAKSREEVADLLEETQRQAEELQAQQEELKQSNEELVEKTLLLEKSEAELKAQQEELQQSNEELEEQANLLEEQKEKLENSKIELENKARELEVTSKYKSDFLANMSHELRTPLNSILILSQLMTENKSESLGEKEVEFARNIHKSGSDLLNLINEILDLSKIESGKLELDIENINLDTIVADVKAMFTEQAKQKSLDFKVQAVPALQGHTITTDMQRLQQIIKNLISNAFKFTPKGGQVTLNIDFAPKDIHYHSVSLLEADHIISFSVSDNGIGIPESKRAIIFEAFQQADGSTKRKYGGTGLGLSISRELAHALGGEIHLHSTEGKGSNFTIYLPLTFDAQRIVPVERPVAVKSPAVLPEETTPDLSLEIEEVNDDRNNIRESDRVILIMEDDKKFYQVLLDFVRRRKYKGIVATQGNTGLSYARYYKPDAILLDMGLPVVDGLEVLKQLKNDPALRHIPVQIISGMDQKKYGLALGAFDYIQKPVSLQDLQQAFDKIEHFSNKNLKKLLVVEDNIEHNQVIRELVGNGDVKSFAAYTGTEAMNMLEKDEYDCIILDLGLPDISGFDLLEKIKTIPGLNRIPVVVYTGRDLSPQENQRLNKLADTVVLKTANSNERLLDETALFLHRVESKLPREKQDIIRKLHKADEVLKDKKVLLVDDDIRNIYSLMNALELEGIHCLTAENGRLAMEELHNNPDVDLVLLDIMMPEMDGYETIAAIRKNQNLAKLPVIALTAKAMKGDREKCLAAGMSDYISKPVNIDQLLSLMRVWLYK